MLTSDERRGAVLLLVLVLAGAGWDAWRAWRPAAPELRESIVTAPAPAAETLAASPLAATAAPVPIAPETALRPVDLNAAGTMELEALPGIGPVLARRILEHRARTGRFRTVEELRAVRGVGPRLLERLRGRVTVHSGS